MCLCERECVLKNVAGPGATNAQQHFQTLVSVTNALICRISSQRDQSVWEWASFAPHFEQVTSTDSYISSLSARSPAESRYRAGLWAEECNVISSGHGIRWSPPDIGRRTGGQKKKLVCHKYFHHFYQLSLIFWFLNCIFWNMMDPSYIKQVQLYGHRF